MAINRSAAGNIAAFARYPSPRVSPSADEYFQDESGKYSRRAQAADK